MAIKYWPIDKYAEEHETKIKEAINNGYLLNDFAYFVDNGFVDLWRKSETQIDKENQTIEWNNKKVKYDFLVEGDVEKPNLPPILIDGETEYTYRYKDNYLGILPQQTHNIYFIGFTRPSTGGLANITEMQSLFTHKMLTNPSFNQEIHGNLVDRIAEYNRNPES